MKGEHDFSCEHSMKANKKGIYLYQKMYSYSKKKLGTGFLAALVALALSVLASYCGSVLACIISIFSLVIAGGEMFFKVLRAIRQGKADDGILVLLSVLVTFFVGYFALAATAMAIYKLVGVCLAYMSGRLGIAMMNAAEVLPDYANLVDTDATVRRIPLSSVTRGMKIMVKTGETVPVDSVISDGFSEFDTKKLYASPTHVSLSAGDKVLGGFVNTGSSVTCETLCDSENSLASKMKQMAIMAEKSSTKGEKRFTNIAKWYPLALLLLAIAVLVVGGFTSGAWTPVITRACVLFVVASTGSYVVAAPLIRSCTAWNLKKKGLSVASADLIDEIADINCVAFEKDGILTDGVYEIQDVYMTDGVSKEDFLMIAANCIGGRQHPISKLLTKHMNKYLIAENVMEFPGKGVECTIMEKTFLCGSENFIKNSGVDIGAIPGYTIYVTIDGAIMGALKVQDMLKAETQEPLKELRQVGVEKIALLTSDDDEVSQTACTGCGADEYYANMTPYSRAEVIAQIKQNESTTCAYIGDVANGSQAMETADVGISYIKQSDTEINYSKAAMMGDLSVLADAIEISRLACSKLEMHFYCATAVKIVLALLGLFGAVNIAAAVLVDALLMAVALLSSADLIRK